MTVIPLMPASAHRILSEVAARHALSLTDVLSRSRSADRSAALFEAMHRMRQDVTINGDPASLYQIGQWLGRRHHSTVVNGIKKHAKASGNPQPPRERREPMLRQLEAMSTDDLKRAATLISVTLKLREERTGILA